MFKRLLPKATLEVILGDFHRAVSRLEYHSEFLTAAALDVRNKAQDLRNRAAEHEAKAEDHIEEARRASGIAAKIKGLVSA